MKIIVYSTPTCNYCYMLKSYLDKKGIKYSEINVAFDYEKAKELIEKTGQTGVPITEIDGEFVVGFDKKRIDELLTTVE